MSHTFTTNTRTHKHWQGFQVKKYAFLLAYFPLCLPWLGYYLGEKFALPWLQSYFTFFVVFFVLPMFDFIFGHDAINPSRKESQVLTSDHYYHFLNLLCLPLQLISLVMGLIYFSHFESFWLQAGWIISFGIISSTIAINVAHELIHRPDKFSQWCARFLLATVCYVGFSIEHVRGHHVKVSTPDDHSSARYNQSIYHFLPITIFFNFKNAWKLENKRLKQSHKSFYSFSNQLIVGHLISLFLLFAGWFWWGIAGILFLLGQSLVAILELETVNYIEHYGLRRRLKENGRYEKVTPLHSWNANDRFSNLLLFNLQRHSDHHAHPHRPYQILRHHKQSPQLPAGYMTMMTVAWLPPLWFYIMNPRVKHFYR